jgi:hypothetical protein
LKEVASSGAGCYGWPGFMKRYVIISLIFLFFFVGPSVLFAQGRDRAILSERDNSLRYLNLTNEQYSAIKRIKAVHVKKILQLKSDVMGKQHEFKGLIGDPATSEETIRSKGREIEIINGQLLRELVEYELSVRKVLTPEQIRLWSNTETPPPIKRSSGR